MNNHDTYDAAVIGGGSLGCFTARNLTRYQISTVLIEAASDVCTGITRANSSVVYPGYDHEPGSLKAEMTTRANRNMENLCRELEVPFSRPGSLMTAFGPKGDRTLQKKLDKGKRNGLAGLELISGAEARSIEPMLGEGITSALWCPSTGTVNPWQLGIAAFENAVNNGCTAHLNTKVLNIRRDGKRYVIETDGGSISVRMVLNCAGLYADQVRELLFSPLIRIRQDASDFLILDKHTCKPEHILFQETEEKGKGITAVPCAEGNLLLESACRPMGAVPFASDPDSLQVLREQAHAYLPGLNLGAVIRNFAAARPNPYYIKEEAGRLVQEEKNIKSFVIDRPEPGFISLIGIKTPGLTCAQELGKMLAEQTADYLEAAINPAFDPHRKAILKPAELDFAERCRLVREKPEYGEIVCQCEEITKGEILEAVQRGITDPKGIRRRLGTGMGSCQGSRCMRQVEKIVKGAVHGKI